MSRNRLSPHDRGVPGDADDDVDHASSSNVDPASSSTSAASSPPVRRPRCPVVIEPVIVLSTFFTYVSALLAQLYVLKQFTDELRPPANMSALDNTTDFSPCTGNKSDPEYLLQESAQAKASIFNIVSTLASSVPALFVSLFLGAYSDKVGRKYAILPPLVGATLRSLGFVLVMALDAPLWYLLVASFVEGCTGSFLFLVNGCFSYIADTTRPEQRMFRITLLEVCIYLSAIFGPIGATQWLSQTGYLRPFLVVLGGNVLTVLYVLVLVPETVTKDPTARFFSTRHVKTTFSLFLRDDGSGRRWKLLMLLTVFFLCVMPAFGGSVSTLFAKNHPLCWSDQLLGQFSAVSIAVSTVGGVTLAKLCKCCLPDQYIAVIVGFTAAGAKVYKSLVQNTLMAFVSPVLEAGGVIFAPTIRTLMSKLASDQEQGAVFGTIAFVETFCNIIGTVLFGAIYTATLDWWTGFVFLSMAMLYLAGTTVLTVYVVRERREDKYRLLDSDSTQASSSTQAVDSTDCRA